MAVFFLLVGLEIKRELVEGELSSPKRAVLPIVAAIGGAIVPAIIYYACNSDTIAVKGWGIPMATDIAFAIGILSLLGNKVPASLKVFLSALAIADDLIAILVIAIFYTNEVNFANLLYAAGIVVLLFIFNQVGVRKLVFYLIPGLFLWYFIHHSGIHATVAGVLIAMVVPTNKGAMTSPLEKLEHAIAKPVNFIIMPIFALANTNIHFEAGMVDGLFTNLGSGIMLGLLLGKPIGITLLSWIIVKAGLGKLPSKATWGHILGLGLLGGIGFTMSIFIALLSFDNIALQSEAKFSILIASTIAGICGYLYLSLINKRKRKTV